MGGGFSKKTCRHHIKDLEQKTSVETKKTEARSEGGLLRQCYHTMGSMVSFLTKNLPSLWEKILRDLRRRAGNRVE